MKLSSQPNLTTNYRESIGGISYNKGLSHSHAGHDHHHGHGHSHGGGAGANFGRAFAIGVALNLSFVIIEVIYGRIANSIALVADAGHNLGDVLALMLAWAASILALRQPTPSRTYGMRRASILAALINAVVLLVTLGGIAWEAIRRLSDPTGTNGRLVMIIAAIGIVINGVTAYLFASGHDDLNIRGAFTHMAADAVISLGVVLAGAAMLWTGWLWLDPVVSLAISVVILFGTWSLLRDSVNLALDAVPAGIDCDSVATYLGTLPCVVGVHDLHVWGMSTTEAALTAHLVMRERDGGVVENKFLAETEHELQHRFGIGHVTLQLESGDEKSTACRCSLVR
ncbi:MAG TPA: cation diffusion facilitator family transporter [Bryobacteraceae bacterium]|jgi:cobalt-zinc-cadmium efflux system protein